MQMTVDVVIQINASTRPTACDCFDARGKTRSKCPVCGGKGGMKGCSTGHGAGMYRSSSGQVEVCPGCTGRGYM